MLRIIILFILYTTICNAQEEEQQQPTTSTTTNTDISKPSQASFNDVPYGSKCAVCEDIATTWSTMYPCKSEDMTSKIRIISHMKPILVIIGEWSTWHPLFRCLMWCHIYPLLPKCVVSVGHID